MKSDIDRLMAELGLEALIVMGDKAPNPYRDYLTNRAKFSGIVVKFRDEMPFIVTSGMEIDEAAKSGLKVYQSFDFATDDVYDLAAYFKQRDQPIRAAIYGVADVANTIRRLADLHRQAPHVEIIATAATADLFNRAYLTKDEAEIAHLKEAARLTSQLVRETWEFISKNHAEGNMLVNAEGKPVKIGDVKAFIRQRELELGLDDPDGCIFAQGRDAAMPHSEGEDDQPLELGKSIVFDIFPRGAKSGYYHDMTRTWCIGYAPPDVQSAYDQVMEIFNASIDSYRVGVNSQQYQLATLDYFEQRGHPTSRTAPGGFDGYVHGLGHGLGLNIHEMPHFSHRREGTPLAPGMVFTIEPGLYYPDRGFGVRVEDTVYLDSTGTLQTLTDFPYDLVVPIQDKPTTK